MNIPTKLDLQLPIYICNQFRTSPIESLYVEANEPFLENSRIKLGIQYATKLKAYPSNPAYGCVFNPLYENVYDKQTTTIQLLKSRFEHSDINLDDIAPIVIPENPRLLILNLSLILNIHNTRNLKTNPLLIQLILMGQRMVIE